MRINVAGMQRDAAVTGMKFIYPETAWEILPTIKIGVGAQAAKY